MKKLAMILATVGLMLASATAVQARVTTGWVEYPSNPVYSPAKAYYPTVLKEGGTYTMWSDGSGGIVQVATSTDGISWTAAGTASGLTTPKHTLVEKIGAEYRIWYWRGLAYSINDIRTATSADGLIWSNDQAITQVSVSGKGTVIPGGAQSNWNRGSYGPADVIYNPAGSATIVEPTDEASVWANKYVMYYDGTTGGDESLGLAVSSDGINWHGYADGVAPVLAGTGVGGDWDEEYVSRATVIKDGADDYHMWYSGGVSRMNEGIGYASSTDGINWTRDASNPIFYKDDGVAWRDDRTYTPMVIGGEMWFTGKSAAGAYTVGYAIPEPATMGLLALGGIGVLVRKRRNAPKG